MEIRSGLRWTCSRNVLERALILSRDGRLHLEHVMAGVQPPRPAPPPADPRVPAQLLSDAGLRQLERENMLLALERAQWRVGGRGGAAALVNVSPSTFKSRMKALGIARGDRATEE